jgi:protein-S-isoprenylcysteine O-methyltransferase Ste14
VSSPESPGVVVPPPLIVAMTLLSGLWFDGRLERWPTTPTVLVVGGAAVITAGLVLIGVALGLFRRAGTRPEPWQASSELVQAGVYRFTRNPMYLGMIAVYSGVALVLLSPTAGLLFLPLCLVLDRLVIAREEAYLSRRFGPSYDAYRKRVRRWL